MQYTHTYICTPHLTESFATLWQLEFVSGGKFSLTVVDVVVVRALGAMQAKKGGTSFNGKKTYIMAFALRG